MFHASTKEASWPGGLIPRHEMSHSIPSCFHNAKWEGEAVRPVCTIQLAGVPLAELGNVAKGDDVDILTATR